MSLSESTWYYLYLKLVALSDFLDKALDINYGGCCYFAYVLAELFEKDDIPFEVVVYECDYEDFFDIDCSCYHYAIKHDKDIINSFEGCNYKTFKDVTSEDLLEHYKECSWNDCYNTKWNFFISKIVKMCYYAFTKNLRK